MLISLIAFTAICFSNCASIIHGSRQTVDFSSQPAGAKIIIDGKEYGVTPHSIALSRKGRTKEETKDKKAYNVKVELPGYYPYEIKLKREMDGWFLGNVVFGGLIGIIIDASNGSMYKLNPDQVISQMQRTASVDLKNDDKVYIAVTLTPDPSWEKIGMLERRNR